MKKYSRTHVSPLAIDMLLHFYAVCERYIKSPVTDWPPAQQAIVAEFLTRGLIEPVEHGYRTTQRGDVLAKRTQIAFESFMLELTL